MLNCQSASSVAKTFTHIIQELESAEDSSTILENSISHLRREIEVKRQLISNRQKGNQKIIEEVANIVETSAQCVVDTLEREYERKKLLQQIDATKCRVGVKRKALENIKTKSKSIDEFTDSIETIALQRSLLAHSCMKTKILPALSDETWEDLSDVDLSIFACSQ